MVKKQKRIIILLVIIVVFLVGCGDLSELLIQVEETVFDQSQELNTDNLVIEETQKEDNLLDDKAELSHIETVELETVIEEQENIQQRELTQISYEDRYTYQLLEESQKKIIFRNIRNFRKSIRGCRSK